MQNLLKKIDAFLAKHPLAETTFGRMSVSDTYFVERLRSGGECLPRTEQKVIAFMKAYKPKKPKVSA